MLLKGMSDDVSSCRDTAFKAPFEIDLIVDLERSI
jgi:hypothetical protein